MPDEPFVAFVRHGKSFLAYTDDLSAVRVAQIHLRMHKQQLQFLVASEHFACWLSKLAKKTFCRDTTLTMGNPTVLTQWFIMSDMGMSDFSCIHGETRFRRCYFTSVRLTSHNTLLAGVLYVWIEDCQHYSVLCVISYIEWRTVRHCETIMLAVRYQRKREGLQSTVRCKTLRTLIRYMVIWRLPEVPSKGHRLMHFHTGISP